jgi:hypothetical protein
LVSTVDGGCRLIFRQTPILGSLGADLTRVRAAHDVAFSERLPPVLDWLEFGEMGVDGTGSGMTPASAGDAARFLSVDRTRLPARVISHRAPIQRRPGLLVLTSVVGMLLLTAAVFSTFSPRSGSTPDVAYTPPTIDRAPVGVGENGPVRDAEGRVNRAVLTTRSPSAPPTRPAPTPTKAAVAVLRGKWSDGQQWGYGYRAELSVVNSGDGDATTWTATLTLPLFAWVTGATGATVRQDGQTVNITPTGTTARVSAGSEVRVTLDLASGGGYGSPRPVACVVAGHSCRGI